MVHPLHNNKPVQMGCSRPPFLQKTQNRFFEIICQPWANRHYYTGTAGLGCLLGATVSVLTGVAIGKVAIISLFGITLLFYTIRRTSKSWLILSN